MHTNHIHKTESEWQNVSTSQCRWSAGRDLGPDSRLVCIVLLLFMEPFHLPRGICPLAWALQPRQRGLWERHLGQLCLGDCPE